DLKTVAITDDPKLQLTPVPVGGGNLVKVHQTSLLFDGSIDTRPPAARSGKEICPRSRPLPVRDLCRVEGIANVVDPGACTSRATSDHRRIVRTVHVASFGGIIEDTAADFWRLTEELLAIGGVVHFEHDLGDDLRVLLVGDVDDVRITVRRRSPRTCRR